LQDFGVLHRAFKKRQIRGYEKNAGKRAGVKMPPIPSTASGKARRYRTFVHIEKGGQNDAATRNQGSN